MFDIQSILYSIPAVIIGFTAHEFAHAFVAYKLGDPTAKDEGRVTLNPLKHIDPIGMLLIAVVGFGWAKPVRFNPANLKRPKLYRMLIALAGPAANLILGSVALFAMRFLTILVPYSGSRIYEMIIYSMLYLGAVNFGLFVFNMIPIPPLDGSHLLFQSLRLSPEIEAAVTKYGAFALLAIIMIERKTGIDILPIGKVVDAMVGLFI